MIHVGAPQILCVDFCAMQNTPFKLVRQATQEVGEKCKLYASCDLSVMLSGQLFGTYSHSIVLTREKS
jgi:hypothetical protein